jgi:hypothetical protein
MIDREVVRLMKFLEGEKIEAFKAPMTAREETNRRSFENELETMLFFRSNTRILQVILVDFVMYS